MLCTQVSVAKKVNDFLQSGASQQSPVRTHATRMLNWLNTLSAQLSASASTADPPALPDHSALASWSKDLATEALEMVDADMMEHGGLTSLTAKMVG